MKTIFGLAVIGACVVTACDDSGTRESPQSLESALAEPCAGGTAPPCFRYVERIAFTRTLLNDPASAEIFLMNPDGSDLQRLTNNSYGDGFPKLSPDGKKILFESTRNRTTLEPQNTSDLFVMDTDGNGQTFLTRGASSGWSPDGKRIAFHRSSSGGLCETGIFDPNAPPQCPINPNPGAPSRDSDIFVANLDDLLNGVGPINLINDGALTVDDDADWSPDGSKIAFTRHTSVDTSTACRAGGCAYPDTRIWVMNTDGTGLHQLPIDGGYEERSPAWSPDGTKIAFSCRAGGSDFELCVMNADGSGRVQLTNNTVGELTPTWSTDGTKIAFHRTNVLDDPNNPTGTRGTQIFVINADGTGEMQLTYRASPSELTRSWFPSWGVLRVLDVAPSP